MSRHLGGHRVHEHHVSSPVRHRRLPSPRREATLAISLGSTHSPPPAQHYKYAPHIPQSACNTRGAVSNGRLPNMADAGLDYYRDPSPFTSQSSLSASSDSSSHQYTTPWISPAIRIPWGVTVGGKWPILVLLICLATAALGKSETERSGRTISDQRRLVFPLGALEDS